MRTTNPVLPAALLAAAALACCAAEASCAAADDYSSDPVSECIPGPVRDIVATSTDAAAGVLWLSWEKPRVNCSCVMQYAVWVERLSVYTYIHDESASTATTTDTPDFTEVFIHTTAVPTAQEAATFYVFSNTPRMETVNPPTGSTPSGGGTATCPRYPPSDELAFIPDHLFGSRSVQWHMAEEELEDQWQYFDGSDSVRYAARGRRRMPPPPPPLPYWPPGSLSDGLKGGKLLPAAGCTEMQVPRNATEITRILEETVFNFCHEAEPKNWRTSYPERVLGGSRRLGDQIGHKIGDLAGFANVTETIQKSQVRFEDAHGVGLCSKYRVMVWPLSYDGGEYGEPLCTELEPFENVPKGQLYGAARATQAMVQWHVSDVFNSCPEPVTLNVFCTMEPNNALLGSIEYRFELLAQDTDVIVLLSRLEPNSFYSCRAKYIVAGARESECSSPVLINTTSTDDVSIEASLDANSTHLTWIDTGADFDTEYVVDAERGTEQASCCPSAQLHFKFEVDPGQSCFDGLSALPLGTHFNLRVWRRAGAERSNVVPYYRSAPMSADPVSQFYFSRNSTVAFDSNDLVLDMNICPPCENYERVTGYQLSFNTPACKAGTVCAPPIPLPGPSMPQYKDEQTGLFKIPFLPTFEGYNWCRCQGQVVNFTVDTMVKTNATGFSTALLVPTMCPQVPTKADMDRYVTVEVRDNGLVSFTFDKSLFNSSFAPPVSYRLILAEKGHENVITACGPKDTPVKSWFEANKYRYMEAYSPVPEGWNPFTENDQETAEFILGSDPNCDEVADDSCNGPLRYRVVYGIRIRAILNEENYLYVETPLVYFTAEYGMCLKTYLIWCGGVLIALAVVAAYLVLRHCCGSLRCSLSCTMRKRISRTGAVVFSRLVWFRCPPCSWASDEEPRDVAHDVAVGVPPPYSLCHFKQLPTPCFMGPQLQKEFEVLCALSAQHAANTSSRVGHLPQNACKNRYCNIIPFDKTRVRLSGSMDDDIANYINASYVAGYTGSTEYIATQGPKENTTKDFWFMVYEQRVRLIVMLTKLVEDNKGKCHQYYPELGDRYMWGDLAVECSVQNDLPAYTLRTIVMNKGSEQRLVHHLHYLDWPDFGCPTSSAHVLQFCLTVRRHAVLFPGLMVVHCSAGVGRTGTLIAVDILMQRMKAKKRIDVFGVVLKLREQRPFMVQCQEQYTFIYKCLKAALEDPPNKKCMIPCLFPSIEGLTSIKKSLMWTK